MEDLFIQARGMLITLLLAGSVFGALALVTKFKTIGDAIARTRREFTTNLGLMFVNIVLLAPLLAFPTGYLRDSIVILPIFAEFWGELHSLLVLFCAVLIYDFGTYWRHRAEHHRLLWPIQATHHADTALHWLTVYRKHPLSNGLSTALDILILLMIGIPEWAIASASIFRGAWGIFIHADVPWTLGILGKILISPAAHRLHHIRDEELMGANFGNTVTLWDKAFRTYVDPAPFIGCETGIAEGTRGLFGELMRPFESQYWRKAKADSQPRGTPA